MQVMAAFNAKGYRITKAPKNECRLRSKRYDNFTRPDRPFLRRDLPAIAVLGQRCGVAMRKSATALKEQIGIAGLTTDFGSSQ